MIVRSAWLGVLAAVVVAGPTQRSAAGATDSPGWLVGKSFKNQMALPVGAAWVGAPLRATLTHLAQSQHVAVLLDRRVDPSREINMNADAVPLASVLAEIARRLGLDLYEYQSVVYFGPAGTTARLGAVAGRRRDEARRLPASAARRYFRKKPLRWDDFATPRQVLDELGRSGPIQINGADRVPHDLLAAADLPALSLVDRLTLFLFPFDLTFKITSNGKGVRVVPLSEDVATPVDSPDRQEQTQPVPPSLQSLEPIDLKHVRVDRLRVKNQPLGAVLGQLAQRWGLQLTVDEPSLRRSGRTLDHRISVDVEGVTVEELLATLLTPEGLTFRLRDQSLEIRAKK